MAELKRAFSAALLLAISGVGEPHANSSVIHMHQQSRSRNHIQGALRSGSCLEPKDKATPVPAGQKSCHVEQALIPNFKSVVPYLTGQRTTQHIPLDHQEWNSNQSSSLSLLVCVSVCQSMAGLVVRDSKCADRDNCWLVSAKL